MKVLRGSKEVRVISLLGTNVKFSVEGREFIADTEILTEIGSFGNLPVGEVFVAPLKGTANGTVVFDGVIAGVGTLKAPVKVLIKDRFAVKFEGETKLRSLNSY
ncbi:MAG: aminopeptidase [Nanopusillaceae archaeon]